MIQPGTIATAGYASILGIDPGESFKTGSHREAHQSPANFSGPGALLHSIDIEFQEVIAGFGGCLLVEADVSSGVDIQL